MSSLAGAAMSTVGGTGGGANGGGPTSPPTCACRLCQEKLGKTLAEELLEKGGGTILNQIKTELGK